MEIATPQLRHVMDVVAQVDPPVTIGESALGVRRTVAITGGVATGSRLAGRILPGVDYQLIRSDGVTEIQARYTIETDAGSLVYVENSGLRSGPPEVMARLNRGEPVDPRQVYFRAVPRFETADPTLDWLMRGLFLCSGIRRPADVELRIFEIM